MENPFGYVLSVVNANKKSPAPFYLANWLFLIHIIHENVLPKASLLLSSNKFIPFRLILRYPPSEALPIVFPLPLHAIIPHNNFQGKTMKKLISSIIELKIFQLFGKA
jgi:hypothetical protein